MIEEPIESRRIYEGRVLNLRVDTVRLPDGRLTTREVVEHGGAVALVPLHDDGTITFVRQYRTPAQAVLLEIPAGGIDPGESPEAAAHRELAEETGLRASRLEHVAAFYTAAGFCSEFMHLYIPTGLSEATAHQDDDENIETIRLTRRRIGHREPASERKRTKRRCGRLEIRCSAFSSRGSTAPLCGDCPVPDRDPHPASPRTPRP